MIFWQKSLPLPNSSRTISTMSSAWQSSLAKIRVLGTSWRPGKISVKSLLLEGLDDGPDLVLGDDVPVEVAGGVGDVLVGLLPAHLRVWRSRMPTIVPASASMVEPCSVILVRMR